MIYSISMNIYFSFHEERKHIKSGFHDFCINIVNKIILSKHFININYRNFIRQKEIYK